MSVRMRTLAAEKLLTSIGLEELQHIKSMSRGIDHEIAPLREYVSEENLDLEDKKREEAAAKAGK